MIEMIVIYVQSNYLYHSWLFDSWAYLDMQHNFETVIRQVSHQQGSLERVSLDF